jgi:ubiquinone/menaquinone biosynthesis C-methylase UbiE
MSVSAYAATDQWKEQARDEWAAGAAAWRKWHAPFAAMSRAATDAIVRAVQATPGMQILDVASGTGEPALALAAAVAPTGAVVASDLVPEMLADIEGIARRQGLTNLACRQAEAEELPFDDHTFDGVTCRFGAMNFVDAPRGLGEMRRVLKPGGRAAFVAWGPRDQNPFFHATMAPVLKRVQLPPPEPGAPNTFKFARPGSLSEALRAAGFRQVEEESRAIRWVWPGPVEEFWAASREYGPSFRQLVRHLPADEVDAAVAEILANLRRYGDGRQVDFPAVIVVATGLG